MQQTHKKKKNDKVEQAIACALFYTDLNRLEYEMLLIEYCWKYAYEFGDDRILISDTFWLWFKNQFHIKTISFSNQLQRINPEHAQPDEYKAALLRMLKVNPDELFPQSTIHNIICNEVFLELQEKGGKVW